MYLLLQLQQRLVGLEVTCNGQDFTDSGIAYLYQADATVSAAAVSKPSPSSITAPLFVTGTHFVNSSALHCRVGGAAPTPATFLSHTLALCWTPPLAYNLLRDGFAANGKLATVGYEHSPAVPPGPDSSDPRTVYVEISNNGLDFSMNRTTVSLPGPCPSGSFCPGGCASGFDPLPCPAGTYCAAGSNANFTLCPRGTYQPRVAQSACLRCPVGFHCPEEGLQVCYILHYNNELTHIYVYMCSARCVLHASLVRCSNSTTG
jgi:Tyrosine-protein kinase ephrin type A/B receptor-like/IPT/TIG domain